MTAFQDDRVELAATFELGERCRRAVVLDPRRVGVDPPMQRSAQAGQLQSWADQVVVSPVAASSHEADYGGRRHYSGISLRNKYRREFSRCVAAVHPSRREAALWLGLCRVSYRRLAQPARDPADAPRRMASRRRSACPSRKAIRGSSGKRRELPKADQHGGLKQFLEPGDDCGDDLAVEGTD
jgi:hypothetical protein